MDDTQSLKGLSLLSFNVFGAPFHPERFTRTLFRTKVRKRFRLIADEITKLNLDVLCLQEVHTYFHFYLLRRRLSNYPHVFYNRSAYGPKGGLVIFSKIPLEQKTYVDFTDRGVLWNKSIAGPLTRKGMLLLKLKDIPLWIINTHLTQNSDRDYSPTNRYTKYLHAQLKQCTDVVRTLEASGNTVIAAGDFNMPDTSSFYSEFMTDSQFHDAFTGDSQPTYHDWYPANGKPGRIDYIFYSEKGISTLKEKAYVFTGPLTEGDKEIFLSDHIGLVARFHLR